MSLTRGDVIADTPLTHGPLTWAEEQWVEENFSRISEKLQADKKYLLRTLMFMWKQLTFNHKEDLQNVSQ